MYSSYKSSPTSLFPFTTSNPPIVICRLGVLFNFLSGCPGLLNSDGTISYLKLHIALSGQRSPDAVASLAIFGSTLKLDCLNSLTEALAPGLLSSPPPRTFENAVELASSTSARLRIHMVIHESDFILAQPGPCDAGLSTPLKIGTGHGTTQKFWIAS
jgi:hypothetical protein